MRNKFAAVWIWLFLLPLAFDFKGAETASKAIQILLTVPSMLAGCLLLIAPRFARRSRMRTVVTSLFMLTMLGNVATQMLQGNDSGNYMRVILPFALMLLGYYVGCRPWDAQRLEQLERAMYWSMIASLIFSFGFGMATSGGGLADVRFRIVSVTFLCLQGLLLHEFVVAQRITKFTVLLFLATIVIELLSVTRSLLVGTALLFAYATWLAAPSLKNLVKVGVRAALILTLLGGMAAASVAFFPKVAEHWVQRMSFAKDTESGRDPTTITRLAERKDQYDQTTSTTLGTLVGMGYGHDYRYSPYYLPDLAGQFSKKDFYAIKEWAAGHNFWVYQFFAGGLLFGLALPIAILWALWRGSNAYRSWRPRAPGALYLPVLGRSLLILAALPATSIGGNPLGNRFSGVVFGVAMSLLVASYARRGDGRATGARQKKATGRARRHAARHAPARRATAQNPADARHVLARPSARPGTPRSAARRRIVRAQCLNDRSGFSRNGPSRHEDSASALHRRSARRRSHRRRVAKRTQHACDGARSRGRIARCAGCAVRRRVRASPAPARTVARLLWFVPAARALARGACEPLRCRDRQRTLAIPELRRLESVAGRQRAVLHVSARHARSVVQAHLPAQASEEMPLLAVGRISRAARCAPRALHDRRGTPARTRVVQAVSSEGGSGRVRHAPAARRFGRAARGVSREVSATRGQARDSLSRPHSREEMLRSVAEGVRPGARHRSGRASRDGRPRRWRIRRTAAHAHARAGYRGPHDVDRHARRRSEVGRVSHQRCVRAALASGKFRHCGSGASCAHHFFAICSATPGMCLVDAEPAVVADFAIPGRLHANRYPSA
ncbi:FIG00456118: hypothetical protein [Candidatus Paraburkholderia kirkii UZHbot1]|uniref:Uncharacterized protein n=1 Tax=Candidatus Paraburkholderia kirkii UZHbot1 TaxID=1055526 RepID=G4MDE5_9BURK|nr:FIG00456118: hypothetical protein [Candidatus Paraburkholderia kirkii UZHbot1]